MSKTHYLEFHCETLRKSLDSFQPWLSIRRGSTSTRRTECSDGSPGLSMPMLKGIRRGEEEVKIPFLLPLPSFTVSLLWHSCSVFTAGTRTLQACLPAHSQAVPHFPAASWGDPHSIHHPRMPLCQQILQKCFPAGEWSTQRLPGVSLATPVVSLGTICPCVSRMGNGGAVSPWPL